MTERDLFRVGMRVCGLFFLASFVASLPDFLHAIWTTAGSIITATRQDPFPGAPLSEPFGVARFVWSLLWQLVGPAALGAVGWYLIFRGTWLLNKVYPDPATPPAAS